MDRAVLKAWLGPFALALGAFVLILLLGHVRKIAAAVLGAGLSVGDLARVVAGLLPSFMVFALPLAHLTAVVVSLGRWADDRELEAWSAAGASALRVARVPVLLGAILTAVGLPIAHWAQPAGWRQLQDTLTELAVRNVAAALATPPVAYSAGGLVVAAASGEPPSALRDVLLDGPGIDGLVVARAGRVTPGRSGLVLTLKDGEAHPQPVPDDGSYVRARFRTARVGIDLGEEVRRRTRLVSAGGARSTAELWAVSSAGGPTAARACKMAARRTALPALALVFGWLGASVAWRPARRRWLEAAAAVLGFYVLMRAADAVVPSLASADAPWVVLGAVWGPHLLLALAGWRALLTVRPPP